MSDLQEELARLKERVEGNMPPGFVEVMHRATNELTQSGIQDQVLKASEMFPSFCLQDHNSEMRDSAGMLNQGPLVITFYRGFW